MRRLRIEVARNASSCGSTNRDESISNYGIHVPAGTGGGTYGLSESRLEPTATTEDGKREKSQRYALSLRTTDGCVPPQLRNLFIKPRILSLLVHLIDSV